MGSQMSRCGDLQCSLSEQSKVPVEGISRRAHRVSNSSRKSRTTSWPTATQLCTALLYCVMLCSLAARSSREPLCSSIVLLHSSFFGLSWGHKHVKEQPSLSLGSENLFDIDYTGFICFLSSLSLSDYQIIIMKKCVSNLLVRSNSGFDFLCIFSEISKPLAIFFRPQFITSSILL